METPFKHLKEQFSCMETDLSPDTLEEAKAKLKEWLRHNYATLVGKKVGAEFNGTMMQGFHWYIPADGSHWNRLRDEATSLAQAGITALWFPPAYKGFHGIKDVGYGTYDLFDLGEFEQRDSISTKYGTKEEYLAAVKACHDAGIHVYADVVFNHKMGADFEEEFDATPFALNNRLHAIGGPRKIRAWTGFNYPKRQGKYSSMTWHWHHFDAVDHNNADPNFKAIWRIQGKNFDDKVALEMGNFDYLMGSDLDMENQEVRDDLKRWGEWILDLTNIEGFRLDAIKHINGDFFNDWLDHLEHHTKRDLFCVGEYWSYDFGVLSWYIGNAGGRMDLFDAPLHHNFYLASKAGGHYDMRRILDGTLMKELPLFAVTLVENHDTQPLQALEAVVESWFKPLAYAIILLRAEGYPCIFYADYYGTNYRDKGRDGNYYDICMISHKWIIDRLLFARQHFAYGPQYDYLDHFNTIGWTRLGNEDHPSAMAVIMSDGPEGYKWMEVGRPNTWFYDITGHIKHPIQTNEWGWGEFRCNGGSVSVWVQEDPILKTLLFWSTD